MLFCLSNLFAASQECKLSGQVLDEEGKPVPYTSIYIPALAEGAMANIEGNFSINLSCKRYKLLVQSMGYKSQTLEVDLQDHQDLEIVLQRATYRLQEVVVDPNSEDPAYNIIRKATAMAQYYKKQITAYEATLYLRNFFDVSNLPWIARKFAEEDELADLKAGDIEETVVEYSYRRPNQVRERIIARRTGRLDTLKSGSSYINLSFYNLGGSEMINPLSRGAFSVYKFEYQSTGFEGAQKVHKIKIIPRRKGSDLMEGVIFINDGIWNINKVDVAFSQPMADIQYKQIYNEVEELVWMPTNHQLEATISLMGFEAEVQYMATLKDLKVEADSSINAFIRENLSKRTKAETDSLQLKLRNRQVSKRQAKIEALIQKEKLNKRETYKLVRLMKQEAEAQEDTAKKSLEVKRDYMLEYDDQAFEQSDSSWNAFRQIPLSEQEKGIYQSRDSLNKIQSGDTVVNQERTLIGNILSFNGTLRGKNKTLNYRPRGLLSGISASFNTVDGWLIEKELGQFEYNNLKGSYFKLTPHLSYAAARKQFMGRLDFDSRYNYRKRAGFYGSIGRQTTDFNSNYPLNWFGNTFSSLIFRENYAKLYLEDYWQVGHRIDLVPGLELDVSLKYAERSQQQNNTDQAWFTFSEEGYTPNLPNNLEPLQNPSLIQDHTALNATVELRYTPKQYYTFRGFEKRLLNSDYPTFGLRYRKGIPELLGSTSDFDQLSFSVEQTFSYRLIDQITYRFEAGQFLNTEKLYFADFQDFHTKPTYLMLSSAKHSFKLLDYNGFNSADYFFSANLAVQNNFILLKYLPLLNQTEWREQLEFNYLYTEREIPYYEFGYSLTDILLLVDVGVFVSFQAHQYHDFGFRIGIDLGDME